MSRVAHPCPTGEKLAATQLASSSYRLLQGVMSDRLASPRSKVQPKTKRPRLHKVILLNDDYTPREFVVAVLKAVFHMGEGTAYRVMMTAHRRGACVVAVYTRDVAETKATQATEAGRRSGDPLLFTTAPAAQGGGEEGGRRPNGEEQQ